MENISWYNATMTDLFNPTQPEVKNVPEETKPVSNSLDTLKKERLSYLTTYCELPNGITYEGEDADEIVLLLLRRDFITNVPWIIITLIGLIPPFTIFFLFQNIPLFNNIPDRYILITVAFYCVLILGYALYNFIGWFYNISLVTDRDIVDIDYSNVTYKDISLITYEAVQEVEYQQSGFLRNFFDYGDVFIQTAGQKENVEFLKIPKPDKVADIINDQKKKIFSGGIHANQP